MDSTLSDSSPHCSANIHRSGEEPPGPEQILALLREQRDYARHRHVGHLSPPRRERIREIGALNDQTLAQLTELLVAGNHERVCQLSRCVIGRGLPSPACRIVEEVSDSLSLPASSWAGFYLHTYPDPNGHDAAEEDRRWEWTRTHTDGSAVDLFAAARAAKVADCADRLARHLGRNLRRIYRRMHGEGGTAPVATGTAYPDAIEDSWQFYAQHPELLMERIDQVAYPADQGLYQPIVLDLVDAMPLPPSWAWETLIKLACAPSGPRSKQARLLLQKTGEAAEIAVARLTDPSLTARTAAASWLADLADPDTIPALSERLDEETSATARAAILAALRECGAPIDAWVTSKSLTAEALEQREVPTPKPLIRFPMSELPKLTWKDGTTVPFEVPRWWVILACRLGDPSPNATLELAVEQLSADSRHELSRFILDRWVACDVEIRANGRFIGSATTSKGILALAKWQGAKEVGEKLAFYLRDFPKRHAQIELLLRVLANVDESEAMEELLPFARAHRARTVRERARTLLEERAPSEKWGRDYLEDRLVPTLGFGPDGTQALRYGRRRFRVLLTDQLRLRLSDEAGHPLDELPLRTTSDSEDDVRDARQQFRSIKKGLKEVVAEQSQRLAASAQRSRSWRADQWRNVMCCHPVMARLARTLVWQAGPAGRIGRDADAGKTVETIFFRPEHGEFLNAVREPIELPEHAFVRIAQVDHMNEDQLALWRAHLAMMSVDQVFPQMAPDSSRELV